MCIRDRRLLAFLALQLRAIHGVALVQPEELRPAPVRALVVAPVLHAEVEGCAELADRPIHELDRARRLR
eukprot:12997060-Alexandrium_andersonii.AAC.1